MNRIFAPGGACRMMEGMRRSRLSNDEWRAIFHRQRTSGLTVKAFCRRAGVALSTFSLWRRKLRGQRGRVVRHPHLSFIEVKRSRMCTGEAAQGTADATSVPTPVEPSGVELHLANGRWIVVRAGFDRQALRDLLAALEAES
jgi:transposase-like protein